MSCSSLLFGSEFSAEDIAKAKASNGLLTIEIEVGTICNFRCRYCYVDDGGNSKSTEDELTLEEIHGVVSQAQALGARKIILLGGEPMIYDFTPELCKWIRSRGLGVEIFTNGTNITSDMASFFFEIGVQVVLKWHSSDHQIQDWLAAKPGAAVIMEKAYQNLRAAGYPSGASRLALSTIICQQNIEELPGLWKWMREEGIEPYFEMITPQGRARTSVHALSPGAEEIHHLYETIQKMDLELFDRKWDAQPPLVGNVCLRHSFSCFVNATGEVMPCVGVPLPVGNIRQLPLAQILDDSEVIADLRNYKRTIQGVCGECEKADGCYGCRGAAYQMTGNYLGSDPLCWRNQGLTDVSALPISAAKLVPHQPPVRMVDALVSVSERRGTVEASITEDNPFCSGDRLIESAHIELMAQAAAALHGYRHQVRRDGAEQRGMLVGVRDMEIHEQIHVGDKLTIQLHKQARLGTFGVISAEIFQRGTLVSTAELTIWSEE